MTRVNIPEFWPTPRSGPRRPGPRRPGRGLSRPDYAKRRARYEARQRRRAEAPAATKPFAARIWDPIEDFFGAGDVGDSTPLPVPSPEFVAEQREEQAKRLAKERFDRICERQAKAAIRAGVPKYPPGQRAYWRAQRAKPGSDERPILAPRIFKAHRQIHASATGIV